MKTNFGYKLFEQDANGNLFPLFIDKNTPQLIGEWIPAEYHPTKGFAARGGWHIGADVPDAPWLKSYDGTETGFYKSRWKTGKRVWCLVEYNAENDSYRFPDTSSISIRIAGSILTSRCI